jgi:hypothetical protein
MNVDKLIHERQLARSRNDYAESDRIRNLLDSVNVFVFDTNQEPEVYHMVKPTTRKELIESINMDKQAEKRFNAWIYSTNK